MWSLLARSDISERTVDRIMALHKLVYDDIPHAPKQGVKPAPGRTRTKLLIASGTGSSMDASSISG
jgi:hypothetical protein